MSSVHQRYKKLELKDHFNLTLTTEKKVLEILQSIGISKAAEIDEVSENVLKYGANILAKTIAEICNTFISSGLFPSDSNIAKLKLLYKKRSKENPENSSSISLLSLMSKVFERIVYDQVDNILRQNNILYNYQSRFRKNHSTDFCLSFLNDKILNDFDKGIFMGIMLIDLRNVFDTTNHEILLGELQASGFSQKAIARGLKCIYQFEHLNLT